MRCVQFLGTESATATATTAGAGVAGKSDRRTTRNGAANVGFAAEIFGAVGNGDARLKSSSVR